MQSFTSEYATIILLYDHIVLSPIRTVIKTIVSLTIINRTSIGFYFKPYFQTSWQSICRVIVLLCIYISLSVTSQLLVIKYRQKCQKDIHEKMKCQGLWFKLFRKAHKRC